MAPGFLMPLWNPSYPLALVPSPRNHWLASGPAAKCRTQCKMKMWDSLSFVWGIIILKVFSLWVLPLNFVKQDQSSMYSKFKFFAAIEARSFFVLQPLPLIFKISCSVCWAALCELRPLFLTVLLGGFFFGLR